MNHFGEVVGYTNCIASEKFMCHVVKRTAYCSNKRRFKVLLIYRQCLFLFAENQVIPLLNVPTVLCTVLARSSAFW